MSDYLTNHGPSFSVWKIFEMFWKIALLSKNCLTYVLLYNGPSELIFSFFQVCSKNFLFSPLSDSIIILDEPIEQLLGEL